MRHDVVISSRVRLARNFEDISFHHSGMSADADACISRVASAIRGKAWAGYQLQCLRDMSDTACAVLCEDGLITPELLAAADNAAAMIHYEDACSVLVNGTDNLRIQALRPGLNLHSAAQECFRLEEAIARLAPMAFDEKLGYLTASLDDTGTGLRASLLLHLPMLGKSDKMAEVGRLVSAQGLNLRCAFGEGADAPGDVYHLSNLVTLGRTEEELIAAVTAMGIQLSDMECALRDEVLRSDRAALENAVNLAMGVMLTATSLSLQEFYQRWSKLRLGTALGILTMPGVDALLAQAQPAHLCAYAEEELDGKALDACRADRMRELAQR